VAQCTSKKGGNKLKSGAERTDVNLADSRRLSQWVSQVFSQLVPEGPLATGDGFGIPIVLSTECDLKGVCCGAVFAPVGCYEAPECKRAMLYVTADLQIDIDQAIWPEVATITAEGERRWRRFVTSHWQHAHSDHATRIPLGFFLASLVSNQALKWFSAQVVTFLAWRLEEALLSAADITENPYDHHAARAKRQRVDPSLKTAWVRGVLVPPGGALTRPGGSCRQVAMKILRPPEDYNRIFCQLYWWSMRKVLFGARTINMSLDAARITQRDLLVGPIMRADDGHADSFRPGWCFPVVRDSKSWFSTDSIMLRLNTIVRGLVGI